MSECPKCGAKRANWMGGSHECLTPDNPYHEDWMHSLVPWRSDE